MAGPWEAFQETPAVDPKSGPWAAFQEQPMSWSDVPGKALQNLPGSAYNIAAGIANTVMHPIDTAQGIYNVGKGAVSKAEGALGFEQDPAQKAQREQALNGVVQFFQDRYGGMDALKKTLTEDPAGFAMDLSTVLTGGQAALARVPGAVRAANVAGKAAELTNPVALAGKAAASVAEPIASNVLGMTTGAGAQPIRQAARAGVHGDRTFVDNMRGTVPLTEVVDQAQSAVGQMRQERSRAYKADMAAVNAAPGHVGYQPIHNALADADKMVNFQGIAKSAEAAKTLDQINDLVSQWRGISTPYTVEAADALKQAIGEIRQKTQPGTLERRVADTVYNAAKTSIVQQAPDYAKAMQGYGDASDKINELMKTFSLGEKASPDTALRKLQSVMRNNVNTNYGQRTKLLDELAKIRPELPSALAGQSLSSPTPRGLAALGAIGVGGNGIVMHGLPALMDPATLAMLPAFSPRVVGEAAFAGGRAARALAPFTEALPGAAKAGYAGGLIGGIGPRYDEYGNPIQ